MASCSRRIAPLNAEQARLAAAGQRWRGHREEIGNLAERVGLLGAEDDLFARFKEAQKEFIHVAGIADFDPKAKVRAAELREEMEQASQQIARDPARMRFSRARGHRTPGQ